MIKSSHSFSFFQILDICAHTPLSIVPLLSFFSFSSFWKYQQAHPLQFYGIFSNDAISTYPPHYLFKKITTWPHLTSIINIKSYYSTTSLVFFSSPDIIIMQILTEFIKAKNNEKKFDICRKKKQKSTYDGLSKKTKQF
jgi:hypothetical protein